MKLYRIEVCVDGENKEIEVQELNVDRVEKYQDSQYFFDGKRFFSIVDSINTIFRYDENGFHCLKLDFLDKEDSERMIERIRKHINENYLL